MGQDSNIEWTHHTFNPWRGCTKVSEGCKHCYADVMSKRNPGVLGIWGPRGSRVVAAESYWRQPLKWAAAARAAGERRRVFCASLADVFEGPETMPDEAWPLVQAARARLFDLISDTPELDWLLLTKRPQNVKPQLIAAGRGFQDLPPWVWIGTSVENQAAADERIPELLQIPAHVRFLSCEPLLGPVSFRPKAADVADMLRLMDAGDAARPAMLDGISWVICGGESGHGARPMHPGWARSLRDQCQAAGVAFHFKQWGQFAPANGDARTALGVPYGGMDDPDGRTPIALPDNTITDLDWNGGPGPHLRGGVHLLSLGKRAAGRLLDGREWSEYPR